MQSVSQAGARHDNSHFTHLLRCPWFSLVTVSLFSLRLSLCCWDFFQPNEAIGLNTVAIEWKQEHLPPKGRFRWFTDAISSASGLKAVVVRDYSLAWVCFRGVPSPQRTLSHFAHTHSVARIIRRLSFLTPLKQIVRLILWERPARLKVSLAVKVSLQLVKSLTRVAPLYQYSSFAI